MKYKLFTLLVLSGIMFSTFMLKAETEGQRAKNAEKYFLAKQYEKACPLYAQLISSNPKNYKYNYYYGICLLISGKDKSQALTYLEVAIQNPKSPEDIYYYMGRALHANYRFDEALRSFAEFNGIIGPKDAPRWQIPQYMQMCNNAKNILDTSKLSSIVEKNEALAIDFFSKYQFASPNGKLLTMPDEIVKSTNSSSEDKPMIFLSANGRVMYYSAINAESNSRDIFRVEKDLDNNWGAAICLDKTVNTSDDEILPTCSNDGRILYFSTRGQNSTGGFDIMKSYYNTVSKTWTSPVNMGSPYNSPDDDFCFVASATEQIAFCASQRETAPGYFMVYKMNYTDKENLPIAINGRFKCIGEPDLKEAKLIISRDGEDKVVAELYTDPTNGSYSIELPGSGTYQFKVEAKGFQPKMQEVTFSNLPEQILVQDIYLSRNVDGTEDLAISNRRLTESGLIDESLTANVNAEGSNVNTIVSGDFVMETDASNGNYSEGKNLSTLNGGYTGNTIQGSSLSENEIIFKVQIGAFKFTAKEIAQNNLSKKADANALTSNSDQTWNRFYIGSEDKFASAKNLKDSLIAAGFKDAFIVAFKGDQKMALKAAQKEKESIANAPQE